MMNTPWQGPGVPPLAPNPSQKHAPYAPPVATPSIDCTIVQSKDNP